MKRESWQSRIGFILAVTGSAIGLANIWRFPYLVGEYGGAAFVFVYLLSLFLLGFPVLMAEIIIGRKTQLNPSGAMGTLGGKRWKWVGMTTVFTGFLVSAFYSAVAGWILGYLVESFRGTLSHLSTMESSVAFFDTLLGQWQFTVGAHALFLGVAITILLFGVRDGIERGNKIFMPLLFLLLLGLFGYGLLLPNADKALSYLWEPDLSALTPKAILAAVGQSFFTLSLGQGTMITYGSYLKKGENLLLSCLPIVLFDTIISLIAATVVFTIVFSVGFEPTSGPGLLFHTLPVVFYQIPYGHFLAPIFFLLVTLAAITSEISALEPSIAFLMDTWKFSRKQAVLLVGGAVFLLGIPCALSTNLLKEWTLFGLTVLDGAMFVASGLLIPLGGFAAVVLCGWVLGVSPSLKELRRGSREVFDRFPFLYRYFSFCFKYLAPVLIGIILINALLSG